MNYQGNTQRQCTKYDRTRDKKRAVLKSLREMKTIIIAVRIHLEKSKITMLWTQSEKSQFTLLRRASLLGDLPKVLKDSQQEVELEWLLIIIFRSMASKVVIKSKRSKLVSYRKSMIDLPLIKTIQCLAAT